MKRHMKENKHTHTPWPVTGQVSALRIALLLYESAKKARKAEDKEKKS